MWSARLWSAETLRTLDFANKAKLVKNKPVVLLDPQVSDWAAAHEQRLPFGAV